VASQCCNVVSQGKEEVVGAVCYSSLSLDRMVRMVGLSLDRMVRMVGLSLLSWRQRDEGGERRQCNGEKYGERERELLCLRKERKESKRKRSRRIQ